MSDSEYEEEEFLVYADFKNQLLTNEIAEPQTAIKIIGIENKNPIAEINGHIFKGTYDYAMGTNVFFEKDNEVVHTADALFELNCRQKYKYFGKTNKVIQFQRAFVEEAKSEKNQTENSDKLSSNERDDLKLNMTYEETIKLFPSHNNVS